MRRWRDTRHRGVTRFEDDEKRKKNTYKKESARQIMKESEAVRASDCGLDGKFHSFSVTFLGYIRALSFIPS